MADISVDRHEGWQRRTGSSVGSVVLYRVTGCWCFVGTEIGIPRGVFLNTLVSIDAAHVELAWAVLVNCCVGWFLGPE